MKYCDKCGVYYRAEHECSQNTSSIKCDVCGIDVTHFDYVKPEIALAEHKKGIYCLEGKVRGITTDMVNSPPHYNQGGIETIDAIREALGADGFKAYCLGNVIKYAWRQKHKGGAEDRAKCAWYARMASGDDPRVSV